MPAASSIALCIPAYRAETFLPRLLQSAQAQTQPFGEILVYDDASPDRTSEVARQLGATVFRGETNRGCSHGKNILAHSARCEWLHFHDADDDLTPDFVACATRWINRSDCADVVLFAYQSIDDNNGRELATRQFDHDALTRDPIAYCLEHQINPFCGLYRRAAFLRAGGWDENPAVLPSEDQAGHLRLAIAGLRFASDPAVTVINRIRTGSMTTGHPERCPRADLAFLSAAAARLESAHQKILARRLWRVAGAAAAFLDWNTADHACALARQLAPGAVHHGSLLFKTIARLSPRLALRWREYAVRLTRPHLRPLPAHHPKNRPATS